jgi:hypothetical protein
VKKTSASKTDTELKVALTEYRPLYKLRAVYTFSLPASTQAPEALPGRFLKPF